MRQGQFTACPNQTYNKPLRVYEPFPFQTQESQLETWTLLKLHEKQIY